MTRGLFAFAKKYYRIQTALSFAEMSGEMVSISEEVKRQVAGMGKKREDLIVGLVGGVGTNLAAISKHLYHYLLSFGYTPHEIKLSSLFRHLAMSDITTRQQFISEEAIRIEQNMSIGDKLRKQASEALNDKKLGCSAVALLSLNEIKSHHQKEKPNAMILNSLKHPSEIELLRAVYRDSFFCVSVFSSQEAKLERLEKIKKISKEEAEILLRRDEDDETSEHGQKTRDSFEMGDLFISENEHLYTNHLDRFIDLIFGRPDVTPTCDEHAMYLAYAASMRSGDLSRHVGASIISQSSDLLAVGANDVPMSGGGQYWPGGSDMRDTAKGYDANESEKVGIAESVFNVISKYFKDDVSRETFLKDIRETQLFDITEFGRAVHAEMEAILSCARNGISTKSATLFCTTFPCHNCAKHIVDAGISKVVFVEAYPKSQAIKLHGDAIEKSLNRQLEEIDEKCCNVRFVPFVGIGPRRYLDLFSMKLGSGPSIKKKKDGIISQWDKDTAVPRIPSSESAEDLQDRFSRMVSNFLGKGEGDESDQNEDG